MKNLTAICCRYTQKNFGRVYPFGLRFDSSNADPMFSWSHGCQLAALNLQGRDRAAWLGHGFFLSNGGCGYVKKPDIFLEGSLSYDDILKLPPKVTLKVCPCSLSTFFSRGFVLLLLTAPSRSKESSTNDRNLWVFVLSSLDSGCLVIAEDSAIQLAIPILVVLFTMRWILSRVGNT